MLKAVQRPLELTIEIVCGMTVFLLPVWFGYLFPTYNVFELNKAVLFRALVALLFLLTGLKIIFYQPLRSWRVILAWARHYWFIPLAFIAVLALLLPFSIDFRQSFHGSYDWQAGWLSYFFNFLWFVLLSFNLFGGTKADKSRREKRVDGLVVAAAVSGFLVSAYACLQAAGIDFVHWSDASWEGGRVTANFGQPNFLASFLLLIGPLNIYLIYRAKRFGWKLFWFLSWLIALGALIFTASRGAWAALILASVLAAPIFLARSVWSRRKKALAVISSLAGLVLCIFFLNLFSPGRFQSLFDWQSGSLAARANFYQAAADAIIKKPLLGYGLENGAEVFIQYYEPEWGVYGDVGASTAQAHNLVLDILLSNGAAGLILFSLWYYFFFSLGFDNGRKKANPLLNGALVFGAAAYLISLLFSFPTMAGEIFFWTFLALLAALNNSEYPEEEGDKTGNDSRAVLIGRITVIGLLLVISGCLAIRQLQVLRADYYFRQLADSFLHGDYLTAIVFDDYIQAEGGSPVNQRFYNWFLAAGLSEIYPSLTELAPRKLVYDRLRDLDGRLDGNGYRDRLAKAKVQAAIGNLPAARENFGLVIAQTPLWTKAYLAEAEALQRNGDLPGAIRDYHLADATLPNIDDQRLNERHRTVVAQQASFINRNLGDICQEQGNFLAAEGYYRVAYKANPADFTLLKKIADTYYLRGRLLEAIAYNQHGWQRNPADYHWPLAIALLYQVEGDKNDNAALSAKYYQDALRLAPAGILPAKLEEYEGTSK